jgi:hypothetical protein
MFTCIQTNLIEVFFLPRFDKCGIISNIRTHLRYNLVNALKNKDLSKHFENTTKSAKQYIYDLLVADYLWNYNYAYTLSIFSSEAPLLVNFSKCKQPNIDENNTNVKQKLQTDYVYHVLETLGIEPDKAKGQSILKEYTENDIPLLICLLQYIKISDINHSTKHNKEQCESKNVQDQMVQTEEVENVHKEKHKIAIAKRKLIQQKDLFTLQLTQKENELKEQTVIMEKQMIMLQSKLDQTQVDCCF